MDLFAPMRPWEELHAMFRFISHARKNQATRRVMQSIFDRFPNPDNNWILDFQTTGFDARIWELYLGGLFQSLRMGLSQPHDCPDFLLSQDGVRFWVEATTVNPTQGTELQIGQDHWSEQDRVGLKLGSALYSKLQKRYWELPHVLGLPLVFAVADFHDPNPVRNTSAPLGRYLYGMHVRLVSDPEEQGYEYEVKKLDQLSFGEKRSPAGYFFQPSAENITAVIFSNAGTIAKFTRMGLQAGLDPETTALRYGLAYGSKAETLVPDAFYYLVGDREESWEEELHVYHNPNATHPLPDGMFGNAIDIRFAEGDYYHVLKSFHPLSSMTLPVYTGNSELREIQRRLRKIGEEFVKKTMAEKEAMVRKIRDIYQS